MRIAYSFTHCEAVNSTPFDQNSTSLTCRVCELPLEVPENAVTSEEINRCIVCPSLELYVRKDFPQWLGVTIVVLGISLSCVAWLYHQVVLTFAILLGSALVDVLLFALVGNQLKCYRCAAEYRDVPGLDSHEAFDLETHEKYRQQAARLAETEPVKPNN